MTELATQELGEPFGVHRSVPPGKLPYEAIRLDPTAPLRANEARLAVEALNIDSASFTQLWQEAQGDVDRFKRRILAIVAERGKLHNPVTGSGGVLVGHVVARGSDRQDLAPGDRLVTLVSLTTTPLTLQTLGDVDAARHQIQVQGEAILFARSLYARLPSDLPEAFAMSVLDVCGAPAQVHRLVMPGMKVAILGAAGKSGLLASWVAASHVGPLGQVLGIVRDRPEADRLAHISGVQPLIADARDPLAVLACIQGATAGEPMDLTINCVNVPGTEMATLLPLRQRGMAYFFSMATSFTAASLGAEAVGQDVDLLMGNGYAQGHADYALDLVRKHPELRRLLEN